MIFTNSEDLTALLAPYHEALADDTAEGYTKMRELVHNLPLPEFYKNKTPFNPDYTIDIQPGTDTPYIAVLHNEKHEPVETFTDAVKAYNYANQQPINFTFTGKVELLDPSNVLGGEIHVGSQWLIVQSDKEEFELKATKYLYFLFSTEEYYANPTDFFTSYHWVKTHPIFWSRRDADSTYWETNHEYIWTEINKNANKELVYMLEAGPAIEPARTTHSHDLHLDVYAPSFEEAYVKLAALIDKFYHLDGTDRENVHYIPSELETLLTERLKRWDEENLEQKPDKGESSEENSDTE